MTFRADHFALVVLVSLALCGCSAAAVPGATPALAGGMIELAVSETCVEGSDPQCTAVGSDFVLVPPAFEQAGVEDAVVNESPQHNAVDVTLTSEGAAVLSNLTDEAAQAGGESRLLLKIGDEIRAAVEVIEPLNGDQVTIALSPEEDPQEVVDLLRGI